MCVSCVPDRLGIFENFSKGTVEIRYNGLEGTGEFWLLNLNVVKSNHQFLVFSNKKIVAKSNRQTYVFDELQCLAICAISKVKNLQI